MEADYDWFQVLVSTNEGRDWEIVSGDHATIDGSRAYYTGSVWRWTEEQIDLTAFVGNHVLVRFEYLTNGADSQMGVVLDDIGILELGAVDGAEQPSSFWTAEGFMRIEQYVHQDWTVAIVQEQFGQSASIEHLTLDADNTGQVTITVPPDGDVTIVIGAMAPFTSKRPDYELSVWSRNQ